MKITILYKLNTPADREIDYFTDQLSRHQLAAEMVDADSRDGAALSELYDALDRPSVLVTDDSGQLIQKWQGSLPSVSELMSATGLGAQ